MGIGLGPAATANRFARRPDQPGDLLLKKMTWPRGTWTGCSLSTVNPGPRMSNAMSLESLVGQKISSALSGKGISRQQQYGLVSRAVNSFINRTDGFEELT